MAKLEDPLFKQAQDLYLSGDLEKARTALENILEGDEGHFPARKRLIEILLIQEEYEKGTKQAMKHLDQQLPDTQSCVLNMLIVISEDISGNFVPYTGMVGEKLDTQLKKLKSGIDFDLDIMLDRITEKHKEEPEILLTLSHIRDRLDHPRRMFWDWFFEMTCRFEKKSGLEDVMIQYEELQGCRYCLSFEGGRIHFDPAKSMSGQAAQDIALHNLAYMCYTYYSGLKSLLHSLGITLTQPRSDFEQQILDHPYIYCYQEVPYFDIRGRRQHKRKMLQLDTRSNQQEPLTVTLDDDVVNLSELGPNFTRKVQDTLASGLCQCPACRIKRAGTMIPAYYRMKKEYNEKYGKAKNEQESLERDIEICTTTGYHEKWIDSYTSRAIHLGSFYRFPDPGPAIQAYLILLDKGDNPQFYLSQLTELYLRINESEKAWDYLYQLSRGRFSHFPFYREQWDAQIPSILSITDPGKKAEAINDLVLDLCNEAEKINELHEMIALRTAEVEEYQELADFYHKHRVFDIAMQIYQSIFNNCKHYGYPRASIYCHQIGDCLTELGHYQESLEWFDEAIEYHANNYLPYCGKSLSLVYLKRHKEAEEILKQGIKDSADYKKELRAVLKKLKAEQTIHKRKI